MNKTTNNKVNKIELMANEIKLMARWITRFGELMRTTDILNNIPEDIEIDHEGDYILYGVDWDEADPIEEAVELYEAGYRLVSTESEKIPDFWGTGYAVKRIE